MLVLTGMGHGAPATEPTLAIDSGGNTHEKTACCNSAVRRRARRNNTGNCRQWQIGPTRPVGGNDNLTLAARSIWVTTSEAETTPHLARSTASLAVVQSPPWLRPESSPAIANSSSQVRTISTTPSNPGEGVTEEPRRHVMTQILGALHHPATSACYSYIAGRLAYRVVGPTPLPSCRSEQASR